MTKREKDLENLIRSKEWFMQALRAVRTCNPPDWLVGVVVTQGRQRKQ